MPALSKELLEIQLTTECGFTLKRIHGMIRICTLINLSLYLCPLTTSKHLMEIYFNIFHLSLVLPYFQLGVALHIDQKSIGVIKRDEYGRFPKALVF